RRTTMSSGASCSSSPFGPFTTTRRPSIVTSTPFGMGIGFLPIRDIRSPHLAEDLAAHAALARLAVGHETLVRGQDRDAHAAEHAGHRVGLRVHAQSRLGDPPHTGDRPPSV